MRFYSSFFTFFRHHSIRDKAEVQNFKNFVKLSVKFSYSSLNTLYTDKSALSIFINNAQFNSVLKLKTQSLTPLFCRKRSKQSKINSRKDNPKFHSAFSVTMLSYALRFRRNWGAIENLEYMGEFDGDFKKCWLYSILYLLVIERCKIRFKNRL